VRADQANKAALQLRHQRLLQCCSHLQPAPCSKVSN
jgi:hypothetical protein